MSKRKLGLNPEQKLFTLEFGRLFIFLIIILIIASMLNPQTFLRLTNFRSMSRQLVEYGLLSFSMAICMISGGIDVSIVYISNLSAILSAMFVQYFYPISTSHVNSVLILLAGVIIAILVGAFCGALNGILISKMHIPAMLATLGTSQLFTGLGVVITGGSTVSNLPEPISLAGTMLFLGVPIMFIVFICVAVLIHLLTGKTKYGIRLYLVGTNEKAARFSGINVDKILISTYMLSGVIASMAGISTLMRVNSAKADYGSSYTLQCILIAVLGGVSPNGGFGMIPCVALAVIILQVLSSLLNMIPSISNFYRDLIWGVTLVIIMIVNNALQNNKVNKVPSVNNKE